MGFPIIFSGIKNLLKFNVTFDLLITMSVLTAYVYSLYLIFSPDSNIYVNGTDTLTSIGGVFFIESSLTLIFFTIGWKIEKKVLSKARKEFDELTNIRNLKVSKIVNGTTKEVRSYDLKKGDTIAIKNGDIIPTDGLIISGSIFSNDQIKSGETTERRFVVGDEIFAGSPVVNGNCVAVVNNPFELSLAGRLISESDSINKSSLKITRLTDIMAKVFTPFVFAVAAIFFVVYYLVITDRDLDRSIPIFIGTLIVACPCAFALATPLVLWFSFLQAKKVGVIFNKATALEKVLKPKTIIFDKTGTVTTKNMKVTKFKVNKKYFGVLKHIAIHNFHPLNNVIRTYLNTKNPNLKEVSVKHKYIAGSGYSFTFNNEEHFLGSYDFLAKQLKSKTIKKPSQTTNYLFTKKELLGTIGFESQIDTKTIKVLKTLKRLKYNLFMISGDVKEQCLQAGKVLGIASENIYYEKDPFEKNQLVTKISKEQGKIIYIGDGINDILALQQSYLSFSLSHGSETAKDVSDITLADNDLSSILYTVKLAKRTFSSIYGAFFWATLYNLVAISLIVAGVLPVEFSAVSMVISNLILISLALSVNFFKCKK